MKIFLSTDVLMIHAVKRFQCYLPLEMALRNNKRLFLTPVQIFCVVASFFLCLELDIPFR